MESMETLLQGFTKEAHSQKGRLIRQLQTNIEHMDSIIRNTIKSDARLKEQSAMTESVPGVGPQTSAHILVTTQGMKLFSDKIETRTYSGMRASPC